MRIWLIRLIVIVVAVSALLSLAAAGAAGYTLLREQARTWPAPEAALPQTLTRMEVNAAVVKLDAQGKLASAIDFYAYLTGSREVALWAVVTCLGEGVPLNLALAVAKWESGFQPATKQAHKNPNGTTDYGLYGLNSRTYADYKPEALLGVELNTRLGVRHLAGVIAQYGVEPGLIAYNCGNPAGVGQASIEYLAAVLRHERALDVAFTAWAR